MHEPIIYASYPGRPGRYVSLELYLFHDDGRPLRDPEEDEPVCYPCYIGLDPTRTEIAIDLASMAPASLLTDPEAPLKAVAVLFGQGNLEDLTLRTSTGEAYQGPFRVVVLNLSQRPVQDAPNAPLALRMSRPIFVVDLGPTDYAN
jgi:hypothetical protein